MKKIKILALSLMISLMLTGAGYAAWSDNLVVNNTVKTGELNANFVKDSEHTAARGAEYVETKIEIADTNAHTVQVTLNNLYPGAWAAFRVKGINSGTIPVKLNDIEVNFSGDKELVPYLNYEAGLNLDIDGDNKIDNSTGKFTGKLENMAADFNGKLDSLKNIKLEPNGNFYFNIPEDDAVDLDKDGSKDRYIIIHLDENAPKTMEKKTLKFTLTINFKQHN